MLGRWLGLTIVQSIQVAAHGLLFVGLNLSLRLSADSKPKNPD